MTALQLARALESRPPRVELEGGVLSFRLRRDTPPGLARAFGVLRTGVAALTLGRPWWGCDGSTGYSVALEFGVLVPHNVTLLNVAGCAKWDRIAWQARLEIPGLFAPPPAPAPRSAPRRPRVATPHLDLEGGRH